MKLAIRRMEKSSLVHGAAREIRPRVRTHKCRAYYDLKILFGLNIGLKKCLNIHLNMISYSRLNIIVISS